MPATFPRQSPHVDEIKSHCKVSFYHPAFINDFTDDCYTPSRKNGGLLSRRSIPDHIESSFNHGVIVKTASLMSVLRIVPVALFSATLTLQVVLVVATVGNVQKPV